MPPRSNSLSFWTWSWSTAESASRRLLFTLRGRNVVPISASSAAPRHRLGFGFVEFSCPHSILRGPCSSSGAAFSTSSSPTRGSIRKTQKKSWHFPLETCRLEVSLEYAPEFLAEPAKNGGRKESTSPASSTPQPPQSSTSSSTTKPSTPLQEQRERGFDRSPSARPQRALVTSGNEALVGCVFPYFPRGGFPQNEQRFQESRSNRWARDWQRSSHWCGMEGGNYMVYPHQCVDGRVHVLGGAALQTDLGRARDFIRTEKARLQQSTNLGGSPFWIGGGGGGGPGPDLIKTLVDRYFDFGNGGNAGGGIEGSPYVWVQRLLQLNSESGGLGRSAATSTAASTGGTEATTPLGARRDSSSSEKAVGSNHADHVDVDERNEVCCPPGAFVITTAGSLEAYSHVVHCVVPYYDAVVDSDDDVAERKRVEQLHRLRQSYDGLLELLLVGNKKTLPEAGKNRKKNREGQQEDGEGEAKTTTSRPFQDENRKASEVVGEGRLLRRAIWTWNASPLRMCRGFESITLPLLGTGVRAIPVETGARVAAEAVVALHLQEADVGAPLAKGSSAYDRSQEAHQVTKAVRFVTNDKDKYDSVRKIFQDVFGQC